MGREGETPAQIFWHIGVKKKVIQVVQIRGRGVGGRGNLDKIQKNSYFFSGNLPLVPLVIIVTLAAPCSTHFISHAQNTWLELQCNTVSEFFKSNKTFVQSEKGWITVKYAAS